MTTDRISARRLFACLLLGAIALSSGKAAAPRFELFAMDNGVGRGSWSPERQASTLHEIGYDGISYNYTNPAALKAWLAALAKHRVKLHGIYFPVRLQQEKPLPAGIEEAVPLLQGSDAVLWLTIPSPAQPGDHEAEALQRIREVADLAASAHLRLVLYPHKGFYLATAEQAFALALRSGRANVGVTVNLCHELAAGNGGRLPEIIRTVAPCLAMVTINGADRKGTGWENYLKLLGTGDYEVAAVLRTLAEVRYRGPVGIQFFNLKGDPQDNLPAAFQAWERLCAQAVAPTR